MLTKREQDAIERISDFFGPVIDLKRSPGVLIEILRDLGVVIGERRRWDPGALLRPLLRLPLRRSRLPMGGAARSHWRI